MGERFSKRLQAAAILEDTQLVHFKWTSYKRAHFKQEHDEHNRKMRTALQFDFFLSFIIEDTVLFLNLSTVYCV